MEAADVERAVAEAGAAVEGRLTCSAYDDFRLNAGREDLPGSSSALSVLQRHGMNWREAVARFTR